MEGKPTLHDQALIALGHQAAAALVATGQGVELVCVRCYAVHQVPVAPLERLPTCCQHPRRRPRRAQP